MAKNLSARIAERAAKKKRSRNAQNRAAFLAVRSEVMQALDDGWPVKTIWETLHEEKKIAFSYQAFRGYVNRLIISTQAHGETTTAVTPGQQTETKKPAKKSDSFKFNANPNKEELL